MSVFYNDNDPKAAAWLRELVADGHLPAGEVSTVSIKEILPDACADTSHFFAGIGGWPLALEIAGWPAERPVWTGSCPCQPFSAAGKRGGADDPRHLWPDFLRLIRERRPSIIFGEQVASSDGRAWFAGVRADLEALGYAVGAADLCSAGVGAPHIRQRLYWGAKRLDDATSPRHDRAEQVAEGEARDGTRVRVPSERREFGGMAVPYGWQRDGLPSGEGRIGDGAATGWQQGDCEPKCGGQVGRLADASRQRLDGRQGSAGSSGRGSAENYGASDRMADASGAGLAEREGEPRDAWQERQAAQRDGSNGAERLLRDPRERWRLAYCRDDRWRRVPVEPALFPLVDGLPGRVGLLRGAGNAIDPHLAARFVRAFMEAAG